MAFYDSLFPQGDVTDILSEAGMTPEQRMVKNRFKGGMKDQPTFPPGSVNRLSDTPPIKPFAERAVPPPAMAAPPTAPPQMNFPLNTPLPQENRQTMLPGTGAPAGGNTQADVAPTGADTAKGGNIFGALSNVMNLVGSKERAPQPMQLMAPQPATPGRSPQMSVDPILLALAGGRLG